MGLGAIAWLLPAVDYDQNTHQPPSTVTAIAAASVAAENASADLEWSPSQAVTTSGDVSGVVTAIELQPGVPVSCGQTALRVNDLPLIAFCAPFPLWRVVDDSTQGADRDAVDAFLRSILDGATNATTTGDLIRRLQTERGAEPTGSFEPTDVVWLGDGFTPDVIEIEVGQRTDGTVIVATSKPILLSAKVVSSLDLPALDTGLQFSVAGSASTFAVGSGRLTLDPAGLGTELLRSQPPQADLPESVQGTLTRQIPAGAVVLPASAVAGNGTRGCVELQDRTVVPVDVLGSSGSGVVLIGDLSAGNVVMATFDASSC